MVDVYNAALYKQNRILAFLTRDERNRLLAKLKPINLKLAEVLYQTGARINLLYFPLTAVVSTVAIIGERKVETSLIGNEGVVGVAVFLGARHATIECIV